MSAIVKMDNFIRAFDLSNSQFHHLLAELNIEYKDMLCYWEV
jgi:hypothetical protein